MISPGFRCLRVARAAGFSFSLAALLPLAVWSQGAPPAGGTIEGRVFNAATGSALANVRATLEGTTREVLTDETGLLQVPAGGVVQRDAELSPAGLARTTGEIVKLDVFAVVADREMSAQVIAMNEQRSGPNIKNVVAVDGYGDRRDESIGEFPRLLPGVAINNAGHVANEITLRGMPSSATGAMVDGGDVMSARGGDTRALSLLEVPTANVSRVEVTKVPTPDLPASVWAPSLSASRCAPTCSRSALASSAPVAKSR